MTTPNSQTLAATAQAAPPEQMLSLNTASNFQFSGVSLDNLTEEKYSLVTVVVDMSGSMSGYEREVENCCHRIVEACKLSPYRNNLLLRLVTFNYDIQEVHGFREITRLTPNEYSNKFRATGGTNLYPSTRTSVDASLAYARTLTAQDYQVNGVVYIITDGGDTSGTPLSTVKDALDVVKRAEVLDSLAVILIGIGPQSVSAGLSNFHVQAGLTEFANLSDLVQHQSMTGALAKLGGMVSRSIVSTSRSLAGGTSTAQASAMGAPTAAPAAPVAAGGMVSGTLTF